MDQLGICHIIAIIAVLNHYYYNFKGVIYLVTIEIMELMTEAPQDK